MRGLLCLQFAQDCFEHAIGVGQHVIVPESEHSIAVFRKPSVARSIAWVRRMLTAIDFDNNLLLATDEVDDKGPNWFLTREFESAKRA